MIYHSQHFELYLNTITRPRRCSKDNRHLSGISLKDLRKLKRWEERAFLSNRGKNATVKCSFTLGMDWNHSGNVGIPWYSSGKALPCVLLRSDQEQQHPCILLGQTNDVRQGRQWTELHAAYLIAYFALGMGSKHKADWHCFEVLLSVESLL